MRLYLLPLGACRVDKGQALTPAVVDGKLGEMIAAIVG
jgi:hypothetical protein